MARLFFCGEGLIDFVPMTGADGTQGYRPVPGGSVYNAAKAAARAGAASYFLGPLSTDLFGDSLAAHLVETGVSIEAAQRSPLATTLAFVDLAEGEARYAFFNAGSAVVHMTPSLGTIEPAPHDILDIGSLSLIESPGADATADFALALAPRLMLAIDPNVRAGMIRARAVWQARIERLLDAAAIVRLSEEDLAFLAPGTGPEDFARTRLSRGAGLVVVTRGGAGAVAWTRAGQAEIAAPRVVVRDTVGAGDTLMGAMLARLSARGVAGADDLARLDAQALGDVLAFATTAAALNCTREGCDPPTRREIEAAMAGG